jgi:AcrR family transcriptional regulator
MRMAILRVAYELLMDMPYAEVTIEKIAAKAGVGKPTIYRRWTSKGPLLLEACVVHVGPPLFPDTGDFARDMRTYMHAFNSFMADPVSGRIHSELICAGQFDEELAQAWVQQMITPVRAYNRERLRAAQQAGQMRPGPPDLFLDLLFGPIWLRHLVTRRKMLDSDIDELIDLVLTGG